MNAGNGSAAPFLSVVIPTFDRPARLATCLEALARQSLPRSRFEVVVVDDGSPRSPQPEVAAVSDRIDVTLLRQANSGPARARNAGAARARGALLVFTDDDCEPSAGWLGALAEAAARNPGAGVGGSTRNALAENLYSEASQKLVDHLYDALNADPGDARFFTSNNLALPAEGYRELGGFAESFRLPAGEDRELCHRWRQRGRRLVYAPEARLDHFHALGPGSFWRQHFRYGRGAHEFRRVLGQAGAAAPFEALSFYAALVTRPLRRRSGALGRALAECGLLCLAQLATALGFFWQALRARA